MFDNFEELKSIFDAVGWTAGKAIPGYSMPDDKPNFDKFEEANVAALIDASYLNADKAFVWKGDEGFERLEEFCRSIIDKVLETYDTSNLQGWDDTYDFSYISAIRYGVGGYFRAHEDNLLAPNNRFKSIVVVAYFGDFTGGDLFYPQYNKSVQMQKGDVAVHLAGPTHFHAVNEVTSGMKYAITMFPEINKPLVMLGDKRNE